MRTVQGVPRDPERYTAGQENGWMDRQYCVN